LTPLEQAVRWSGLGAVLVAVLLVVAEIPGSTPFAALLFLYGVGAYVAMVVLAHSRHG